MVSGLKSSHDFIDTRVTSQEKVYMVTGSRVITEGTVSNVSANEVETSENCSQALESKNTDDPLPSDETSTKTEFLSQIPQYDQILHFDRFDR